MSLLAEKPIAVIHDQQTEFNPAVAELWGRDIPVVSIDPRHIAFDSSERFREFSLVYNDLGGLPGFPFDSSFVKSLILYTRHLESSMFRVRQGRIINGSHALEILTNRARQISHFASLNVRHPRTLFVGTIDSLIRSLHAVAFPIVLKSNTAGTASRILRFDSVDTVIDAIFSEQIRIGSDPWLLQELIEPKGGYILRLDILNGHILSSRKVYTQDGLPILNQDSEEGDPSESVTREAEHILRTAGIDLGSVELLVDRRNNDIFFYNILPFVYSKREDPQGNIITRVGDYIERRLNKIKEMELSI